MNKTSKFKKVLSVVLVMMMMLSCLTIMPLTTSAADAAVGTTADNPYKVGSKADLEALPWSGTGALYVELTGNIDLGDSWTTKSYTGGALHLNGNNYKIYNATVTGQAFLKKVGVGSVIENLHFSDIVVDTSTQGASIVLGDTNSGLTMVNVSTDDLCKVTSSTYHAGGLIGRLYDTAGTPSDTKYNIVLQDCVNNADVRAPYFAGGILGTGYTNASLEMLNCTNNGNIETYIDDDPSNNSNPRGAGGIIGQFQTGSILRVDGCKNTGNIKGYRRAGGIVGLLRATYDNEITHCINEGKIESVCTTMLSTIGGIVGFYRPPANAETTLSYCINSGEIYSACNPAAGSNNAVGGMLGHLDNRNIAPTVDRILNIFDCYNTGKLTDNTTDTNYTTGGITGWMQGYHPASGKDFANLARCYDNSTRVGTTCALAGWGDGSQLIKTYTDCYSAIKADSAAVAKLWGQTGSATVTNTGYFTEDATHTIENVEIAMSNGEATTIAAEMARIDAVVYGRQMLDISAKSQNLSARLKLTDPHGFMVITSTDVVYDEAGFIFYESETAVDASTVMQKGKVEKGDPYKTDRFAAAYTGVRTTELDTTVYFVAYVKVEGKLYVSDVRDINLYDKTMEAAEDGYFGTAETGVYVPAKEKAVYRAMIDYYHAHAKLDEVAWDA